MVTDVLNWESQSSICQAVCWGRTSGWSWASSGDLRLCWSRI